MLLIQLKIAYRSLLRNRRKSLISFLAISLGTASIVVAGGFFDYMFYALYTGVVYGEVGHLQVTAEGFIDKGVVSPFSYMIERFDTFQERFGRLPHVRLVMPRIQFSGLISSGETTGSFIGVGVDPVKEWEMTSFSTASGPTVRFVAGRRLQGNEKNAVVLGKGLATAIGAKPGQRVTLLANTESGSINGVTVEVAGIFESFQKDFDDHALQIPIGTAQTLLGVGEKVHIAVYLLDDGEHVDATAARLRDLFNQSGSKYEIRLWRSLASFYNATVALFRRMFLVINVVIALVVVLGIANSIMMSIFEQTRDIGTIMAIGTKPNQVVLQYLLEGVLLGIMGGIVGLVAGLILSKVVSVIGIPMPPPPGGTREWVAKVTPPALVYLRAFCTAALAGVLASLYPAIRASRLRIVEALRQT